jgi:hypothetical protein
MVMQVTPGFGTAVATELKGNAHHQRIISHDDALRAQVVPAVSAVTYTTGKCLGGEMIFSSAARLSGDVAWLSSMQILLRGLSTAGDIDAVFYSEALAMTPVNGNVLTLTDAEAQSILGVVHIASTAFRDVGDHKLAHVSPDAPLLLQAGAGVSTVRCILIARGGVKPAATDSVVASITVRRS